MYQGLLWHSIDVIQTLYLSSISQNTFQHWQGGRQEIKAKDNVDRLGAIFNNNEEEIRE